MSKRKRDAKDDPRFSHIATSAKFRPVPKKQKKFQPDERFKDAETEKFTTLADMDKYGRPLISKTKPKKPKFKPQFDSDDRSEEQEQVDSGDELSKDELSGDGGGRDKLSEDELSSSQTSLSESIEEVESESTQEEVPTGEATKRLAVVGIAWNVFRAQDIWVVLSSFLPPQGVILSVRIYPSDFGLKEMAEEELKGPPSFLFEKKDEGDDDDARLKAIRKYEKKKRKYYFGVVDCDSVETANALYTSLNGTQIERSSRLDLRFIDDDLDFTGREIKSECLEPPSKYAPIADFLQNDSLHTSKPSLQWDDSDKYRTILTQRKFSTQELNEMDFAAFLESASSSEDDEAVIAKYKALLVSAGSSNESGESDSEKESEEEKMPAPSLKAKTEEVMAEKEMTFTTGLTSKAAQLVNSKIRGEEKTIFERQMEKEKEKKRARKELIKQRKAGITPEQLPDINAEDPWADFEKDFEKDKTEQAKKKKKQKPTAAEKKTAAELELLAMDPTKQDKEAAPLPRRKKAQKKAQKAQEIEENEKVADAVLHDQRFTSALIQDPRFAIDPTRKTSGAKRDTGALAAAIRQEKFKKPAESEPSKSELKGMVTNLKANFNKPPRKRT